MATNLLHSFTVIDTDRGMDAKDLQSIFKRFGQVDVAVDSRHGSGLGLTIVE